MSIIRIWVERGVLKVEGIVCDAHTMGKGHCLIVDLL